VLARGKLAAMSGTEPERRGGLRRRAADTASGLALTVVLALLGLGLVAALLAGLAFMAFAMPLSTAAIVAVLLIGGFAGWKAKNKRR
jgi:hypothetical protein